MKAFSSAGVVLLLAVFCMSGMRTGNAQDSSDAVTTIRKRYAAINQNLPKYKTIKKELLGFSTEGGELTAYFEGPAIRKIVARFQGESGRALEEYYYWEDELQFVYRKEDTYSEPMSGKVTNSAETRFYFDNGKLIRWLNHKGKPMRRGNVSFDKEQEKYLSHSKLFLAGVRSVKSTLEAP